MDNNEQLVKIYIGIGCKRGVSLAVLKNALDCVLEQVLDYKYSYDNIASISTIDIKSDEEGLLELAERLNKEIKFYSAEELNEISVDDKSEFVAKITGTYSVSEAAAIKSSELMELIVPKTKFGNITIAVAR